MHKSIIKLLINQMNDLIGRVPVQEKPQEVYFLKFWPKFLKFRKCQCGFWGACIVGFVVLWGIQLRLSLQTHYH